MTTAHRPTLESKKGKQTPISDSIQHARLLPAHTQLKFRTEGQGGIADSAKAVEELKLELLQNEKKHYLNSKGTNSEVAGRKLLEIEAESKRKLHLADFSDEDEPKRIKTSESKIAGLDSRLGKEDGEEEGGEKDDERDDEVSEESYNESGSDEDEDSDEETEALMAELEKIKQERLEAKKKAELEEKTNLAAVSNPLMNTDNKDVKARKGWRNSTSFKNQHAPKKDKKDTYVNDQLHSEDHSKFLSRYVR